MKLIRYEFAGEGIFDAMDYLYSADMDKEDQIDFSKIENTFKKKLPAPLGYPMTGIIKFYFTEYGYKRFYKELTDLCNLFDIYCINDGQSKKISINVPDDTKFNYRDKFQVALDITTI